MTGRTDWVIYGANGYTRRLVAAEARRRTGYRLTADGTIMAAQYLLTNVPR
jgi:short subunit dehydrogenase-like uncharacterized protein